MAGGLMAIGPGHYKGYYGAAAYVDKILHRARPADLPVHFRLVGRPRRATVRAASGVASY
ncbi:MAG TPA: hypothetical protein VKC66_02170 [Xanthobacteraceae bacterium]|nr:hypothetical protein [Xanthobacteraceae bacterium]